MTGTVQVGLVVANASAGSLETAQFAQVSIVAEAGAYLDAILRLERPDSPSPR